jgi:hypothetical protein
MGAPVAFFSFLKRKIKGKTGQSAIEKRYTKRP